MIKLFQSVNIYLVFILCNLFLDFYNLTGRHDILRVIEYRHDILVFSKLSFQHQYSVLDLRVTLISRKKLFFFLRNFLSNIFQLFGLLLMHFLFLSCLVWTINYWFDVMLELIFKCITSSLQKRYLLLHISYLLC